MSQVTDLVTRLRADPRVATVERALLGHRLGLGADDLELLAAATVRDLLDRPGAVTTTVTASRLLERLDARQAREHPVDVEHYVSRTVARVLLDHDDVAFDVTLHRDGLIDLDRDVDPQLTPDDAEALAYALLRLAALARDPAPEEQT